MDAQLRLLEGSGDSPSDEAPAQWRLDDSTREVGRHGIDLAREALRRAAEHRIGQTTHTTAA